MPEIMLKILVLLAFTGVSTSAMSEQTKAIAGLNPSFGLTGLLWAIGTIMLIFI